MGILDKVPNLFKEGGMRSFRKSSFKKFDKKALFPGRRDFIKREEVIKKITLDKTRIPKTGWAPAIRGSYLSRTKRKELAENLFPKEKFGDYISKKKFKEMMIDLQKKTKEYKPSMEKFQAQQKYDYLKKKSGL
ncbi:MAG: hypothetical protein PHY72_01270 [Candidatus Pacebacteria bacterium]|nr:hypothetical protein [Candidatus Paceibacterota bacterium]